MVSDRFPHLPAPLWPLGRFPVEHSDHHARDDLSWIGSTDYSNILGKLPDYLVADKEHIGQPR